MYCVRCGRKAMQGEKRCAVCNMRLVSPAKLNRLLNEEKEAESDAFEKFLKDAKKKLSQWGQKLGPGIRRLSAQIKILLRKLWALLQKAWAKSRVWLKKTYKLLRKKLKQLVRQIKARIAENKAAAPKKAGGTAAPVLRQKKPAAAKPGAVRTTASPKTAAAPKVRTAASRSARPVSYGEDVYGSEYRPKSVSASRGTSNRTAAKPSAKKASVTAARPTPKAPVSSRKPAAGTAGRTASPKKRTYADNSFAEKNARSIVSMGCLLLAFILLLMWGTLTGGGKRTFATLGMGSSGGYVLLGDDCMQEGNYSRAVEHYYKALSKKITYEAAYKLAAAYSHTGDISREVSSLLLCVDYYPKHIQPYKELVYLYPYADDRPEKVARAIQTGEELYGTAIYEP